jgi:hypothetical protein
MGRAPLVGEVWEISGTLERDPEHGEQVIIEAATLTRPNGHLLIDVLLNFEPRRDCRRLYLLRGWSHDEEGNDEIRT